MGKSISKGASHWGPSSRMMMESGCTPTSLGLRIGLILCILLEFTSRFHERMTISNLWWQLIIMDKMDEGNGLKTQLYWAYLMVMSSGWLGASGMQQLGPWLVTYLFQKYWFKMNTCTYFLTRGLCLRCRTPCFCSSWNITPLSENIFKLINLNFWSLLKDISWKSVSVAVPDSEFIILYWFIIFCLVFYPSFMKLLGLGYLSTILSLDASFCFFILWKWLEFQEGDGKSTMSWNWEWLPKNRQEIHWKYINHLLLKSFWYNSNTLCWLLIKIAIWMLDL